VGAKEAYQAVFMVHHIIKEPVALFWKDCEQRLDGWTTIKKLVVQFLAEIIDIPWEKGGWV
jgi:hypothetical protein